MFKFIGNFYQNLGYWGIIRFTLKVENCRGVRLYYPHFTISYGDEMGSMELDMDIKIERDYTVTELIENTEAIVEDIFQEYLWCISLDVHRAIAIPVDSWIDRIKFDTFGKKTCPKCNKKEMASIDNMCRDCRQTV